MFKVQQPISTLSTAVCPQLCAIPPTCYSVIPLLTALQVHAFESKRRGKKIDNWKKNKEKKNGHTV